MRHTLPKVLAICLAVVIFSAFPSQSLASQLSLIFPIPTITMPPMPNAVPLPQTTSATTTIQQSIQIHTGTTLTPTPQETTTTAPTLTPKPTRFIFPTTTLRIIRISPTIKPTKTPTPTPTTKPQPTTTPNPTANAPIQATPTVTPTGQVNNTPTTSIRDYIMTGINNYRKSLGLSAVQTNDETCNFAKTRAREITTDFSHAGFENRIANKTLPYTSWSLITENIAMTSNYKDVVNMWINSPGHAANMQKDTPFVCVENSGNYYAYEGMRP